MCHTAEKSWLVASRETIDIDICEKIIVERLGLGLGTGNGDWDWGLGLGTGIGDWDWGVPQSQEMTV